MDKNKCEVGTKIMTKNRKCMLWDHTKFLLRGHKKYTFALTIITEPTTTMASKTLALWQWDNQTSIYSKKEPEISTTLRSLGFFLFIYILDVHQYQKALDPEPMAINWPAELGSSISLIFHVLSVNSLLFLTLGLLCYPPSSLQLLEARLLLMEANLHSRSHKSCIWSKLSLVTNIVSFAQFLILARYIFSFLFFFSSDFQTYS